MRNTVWGGEGGAEGHILNASSILLIDFSQQHKVTQLLSAKPGFEPRLTASGMSVLPNAALQTAWDSPRVHCQGHGSAIRPISGSLLPLEILMCLTSGL